VATVVRPRPFFFLLLVLVWFGSLAFMLTLEWDVAQFDPRVAYFGAMGVFGIVASLRAKLVITDGTLRRGRTTVSLERLASVEISRAKFLKQQGWVRTIASFSDRDGNAVSFKPLLWRRGAADVRAIVQACARRQDVELDEKTRDRLAHAAANRSVTIPVWALRKRPEASGDAVAGPVAKSSFWTRRAGDGSEKKFQPQRLLVMLGAAAVFFPAMIVVRDVGTSAVRSLKCSDSRELWTQATEFTSTTQTYGKVVDFLRRTPYSRESPPFVSELRPLDIANNGNSSALQRDAQSLIGALMLRWENGPSFDDVQIEDFGTHAAAMQFQRDYAEDHCHKGDTAFAVPSVPGAYGFRCKCTGAVVDDRVAFVRGNLRVQAITWGIAAGASHERASSLAELALSAFNDGAA
jgi:hypothetical protein